MSTMALDTVRIFLHVIAATIWVGGQLTLAGLVPALRAIGGDAPKIVARQFRRIAWPAFAVLVVTGGWNVAAQQSAGEGGGGVLMAKMTVVLVSGLTAFLHERATTKRGNAIWGALTALSALTAVLLGVILSEA
jgi:putative copper export protein